MAREGVPLIVIHAHLTVLATLAEGEPFVSPGEQDAGGTPPLSR